MDLKINNQTVKVGAINAALKKGNPETIVNTLTK